MRLCKVKGGEKIGFFVFSFLLVGLDLAWISKWSKETHSLERLFLVEMGGRRNPMGYCDSVEVETGFFGAYITGSKLWRMD